MGDVRLNLAAWYPQIKSAHLLFVAASALLFLARGAGLLAGQAWPRRLAWRRTSWCIDTLLLGAGVTMWTLASLHPLRDAWLGAKLVGVLLYIGLGFVAFSPARGAGGRGLAMAAALLVLLWIVGIALAHDPAGPIRLLELGR